MRRRAVPRQQPSLGLFVLRVVDGNFRTVVSTSEPQMFPYIIVERRTAVGTVFPIAVLSVIRFYVAFVACTLLPGRLFTGVSWRRRGASRRLDWGRRVECGEGRISHRRKGLARDCSPPFRKINNFRLKLRVLVNSGRYFLKHDEIWGQFSSASPNRGR